jgi:hypothetical protein
MTGSTRLAAFRAAKGGTAPDADLTTPSPLAGGGNPKPNSPEKPDDEDTEDEEEIMTEQEIEKMKADARAEGVSASHARYNAVLASEHFAGREAMATKLLAKDGLSADDIIDVLSGAPATAAAAPAALDKNSPDFKAAVDAQARDAMAKLLPTAADNADLRDGGEPDTSAKDEDIMLKAVERRNASLAATA